jgi:lipoprotein signal peptidase
MPGLLVDGRGGIAPAFKDKLQFFQLYRPGLVAAHAAPLVDVLDRFVHREFLIRIFHYSIIFSIFNISNLLRD